MIKLNFESYKDKVTACWLGKNIGGTLGAPLEWRRQTNDVTFYTQELGGDPLPNDDLDIQFLWLIALEERGLDLDAHQLAEYWCLYVTPHWSEYGTSQTNMRAGLVPPLCGSWRNIYKHSCGAFIRSEIWACIAPGLPDIAARYAYEDGILDHGDGEGTFAEIFMAALEAAAFVQSDLRELVEIGLSYIPAECGVAQAVRTAVRCFDEGLSWQDSRDEILRLHRGGCFYGDTTMVSPEDLAKGFDQGQQGYGVPSNIAITIYGLLYGGDDFDRMICTTVNMGEDTDCTGATAGSIWGLIHGTAGIPQRWVEPIGRGIEIGSLNLGDLGLFGNKGVPDVDGLTERVAAIAQQLLLRHSRRGVAFAWDDPDDLSKLEPASLRSPDGGASLYTCLRGPRYRLPFFDVELDYGDEPVIRSGEPKTIRLTVRNTYKPQTNMSLHWYLPEGWSISPSADGVLQCLPERFGPIPTFTFTLTTERVTRPVFRATIELAVDGRPLVMTIPIMLLNGDLYR